MLKLFRNIAVAFYAFISLLVIFAAPAFTYACKSSVFSYYPVVIALSILFVVFFACFLGRKTFSLSDSRFNMVLNIAAVALFAFQLVFIYLAWFRTGWDVWWLTSGTFESGLSEYLSRCPNQIVLFCFIKALRDVCGHCGIDAYLVLVLISCICCNLSLQLITRVARLLFDDCVALVTLVFGFLFIGLSPWALVPYSDTFSMPFTVGILYCAVCRQGSKYNLPVMLFLAGIGYLIKPTVIFIALSLLLAMLSSAKSIDSLKQRFRRLIPDLRVAACTVLVLVAVVVVKGSCAHSVPNLDDAAAQGMTHFLYMGANDDAGGVYNVDDIEFSSRFTDSKERSAAEIAGWKERISSMGPLGTVALVGKKTLTNFADGMFGWTFEGNFFFQFEGHSSLGASLIGAHGNTKLYRMFQIVSQSIWFFILIGVSLGFLRGNVSVGEGAVYFSICMLAVFLMVFEARGRYLVLYLPYFVMLGVAGVIALGRRIRSLRG